MSELPWPYEGKCLNIRGGKIRMYLLPCESCSSNQGSIENTDNFYTNGEDQICDAYFWNIKNILALSGDMHLFFSVNLKL